MSSTFMPATLVAVRRGAQMPQASGSPTGVSPPAAAAGAARPGSAGQRMHGHLPAMRQHVYPDPSLDAHLGHLSKRLSVQEAQLGAVGAP